jgi:uncharacterized protein YhaN
MKSLRFEQLRFGPWGCFRDLEIEFASRPGGVELVVGPNAAGKSTAARGMLGLLFGIESRTSDAHTFPYQDLRIGARVQCDGDTVPLVRRKGRTGTLTTPEGERLPDDTFMSGLGGLSREVFEALFMIDNPGLKQGGAELLQGRGEVGTSLFAAAAGIATLHEMVAGLEDAGRQLFNPSGRKDPVHNALRDLHDAEKRLRDATLRPRKHRDMELGLEKLDRRCKELFQEIGELQIESANLTRRRKVAPLIGRHTELHEELEGYGDAPDLSEDAVERRAAAETRHRSAQGQLSRAHDKSGQLSDQIDAATVDEEILLRAEEIRAAHEGISATRKAAHDRPKLERELAAAEERLRTAAELAGIDADEIESLRRSEVARRELDAALRSHSELAERQRVAKATLATAGEKLGLIKARRAEATAPPDVAPLQAAIRAGLKLGPVQSQAADERAEGRRLTEEAASAMRRLAQAPGSLDELGTVVVPSREAVERIHSREGALDQAARDLAAERSRLERDSLALERERDELELDGSVPSQAELRAGRRERDRTWKRIRAVAEGEAELEAGLPLEYERQLVHTDAIADAQLSGATQLERAAKVEAAGRRITRESDALARHEEEISLRRLDLAEAWAGLWAAAPFDPPAVADAGAWLDQRDRILELVAAAGKRWARRQSLEEQASLHKHTLTARLEALESAPADAELGELIELAETTASRGETRQREHAELDRVVAEAEHDLEEAEKEASKAQAAWDEWVSGWPALLDSAGLPPGTTPVAAPEVARAVDDGLDQIERIAERSRRIVGIDRDRSVYEEQVAELSSAVAPDLVRLVPERAAAGLMLRLGDNDTAATKRAGLLDQQARVHEDVEGAGAELAEAKQELDALVVAASCKEVAELPAVEARASRARELRQELRRLERQVVEVGELRFDELVRDVEGFEPAEAGVRIRDIEEQIARLGKARDELKEEIGSGTAALEAAEADVSAVEAAEDIELAKAEVEDLAKQYMRARLAVAVVRRAMERYRRLHQNPLLERANQLFARFTLGSFVELFVDHDENDGAVLVGRQRDRRLKRVHQMSSGTREQLFLSLRIAAIERYIATAAAVPVIFDDAFLESDDKRSEKIFEVLAEVAEITQVVVLTHRQQLAELGQRVLGGRLAVHQLPDAAPALRAAAGAGAAAA